MVPMVKMANNQQTDVMGYLAYNRIIFIGEPITDKTCERVVAELIVMELQDPKAEIKIYMNSMDGMIYPCFALVDMIQQCKCPVSTVAFGMVGGPCVLVLAAGTKGRRCAMPHSRLMIHQAMGGGMGSHWEVNIQSLELNRSLKIMNQMFSNFTGQSIETMEEEIDRENYYSPDQAQEFGFIDSVLNVSPSN